MTVSACSALVLCCSGAMSFGDSNLAGLSREREAFDRKLVTSKRWSHSDLYHNSLDGGRTMELFPVGRSDRRYLLGHLDWGSSKQWVLMRQTLQGKRVTTDWLVLLESAPEKRARVGGTLRRLLLSPFLTREVYSGGSEGPPALRVPEPCAAEVKASLDAVKGFAAYDNPPMFEYMHAWFVHPSGTVSAMENHDIAARYPDGRIVVHGREFPVTKEETRALRKKSGDNGSRVNRVVRQPTPRDLGA